MELSRTRSTFLNGRIQFCLSGASANVVVARARKAVLKLSEGLEGLPLGFVAGETYNQQSIRLNPGDMILAFSDGATDVRSPDGTHLNPRGFLELAEKIAKELAAPLALAEFSQALLHGVQQHCGCDGKLDDDVTLLTL